MTRTATTDRPKRSAFDALAHVTAEITRFLEQGVMPWRAPWDPDLAIAATPGLPLRSTGEPYRGANVALLWAAQIARGYSKRTWLTFRQALELGGHVRKGEKACPVIYYGQATAKNDQSPANGEISEQERRYRFLKLFHVFNVEQIDDLPEGFGADVAPVAPLAPSAIEQWSARAGVCLRIGGASAFYSPVVDAVHIPPRSAFLSDEHWDATLLHEDVHFTGHKSRLDRLSNYHTDRKARAREELCAELGAAMLGAMFGLAPFHLEDHAAYLADWLRIVRDEPRAFLSAGAKAQAAVDWLVAHAGHPPG
jgi:antirestriction protein ArdC